MPSSFTSTPTNVITMAGQKLMYTCQYSTTIPSGFRFIIEVYAQGITLIGKYYLAPNANNRAHFDLGQVIVSRQSNRIVDTVGNPLFPSTTVRMITESLGNRGYQVRVGSFDGTTETLNEASHDIAVLNGYFQRRQGLNPSMADFYPTGPTKRTWLSSAPVVGNDYVVEASEDDEGYISWIYSDDAGATSSYVHSQITNNGSAVSNVYSAFSTYSIVPTTSRLLDGGCQALFAGMPKNWLSIAGYTGDWDTIQHRLLNNTFGIMSGWFKINRVCYGSKNETTQMAFTNSVGGWDHITWTGRRKKRLERSTKNYQKNIGTWGGTTFSFNAMEPEVVPYQVQVEESYTLNKIMSLSEMPLLQDLAKSRQIFMDVGGTWIPVVLDRGRMDIEEEPMSKVMKVSVEVKLAQEVEC